MRQDSQYSALRDDLEQALAADPEHKDYHIRQALQRLVDDSDETNLSRR